MNTRRVLRALLAVALAEALALGTATGAGPSEGPPADRLRVTFWEDVFSSVNRADASASAKAWMEAVGRRRGVPLNVVVSTYDSIEALRNVIRTDGADLLIMNSLHYLELGPDQSRLEALFVPERDGYALTEYLLVTRAERPVELADLRGGKVLFLRSVGITLARSWMTILLQEEDRGTISSFFASAQDAEKASAAVLPVFFGQADACVVDRASFELMRELNPQIGTALAIRRESVPYLENVLCLRRDYREHRDLLLEGLPGLPTDPSGKQILLVFRTDRILPFTEEQLTSLRALRAALRPGAEAELR